MSQDVITVGSTMRISLLYRGEYSQGRERFMNYLEEQMDGEAMINSIQNGDHPLPVVAQKKTRKIDHLARSLLIQRLSIGIYSLIDSNDTAKNLWHALERQMRGSEYGEQDRKAAILYEYETFKATEGEQLLDTYICYLQVINDLKKCGYKKDNCELNYKFLNNLQPEWKQYGTLMRQIKNLMDINIDALYNILKQNQGDVNNAFGYKKKAVVVTSDPLALVAEKTKITALLAKAFNRKKYYAKPTNNNLRTSSASSTANKKPEYVKSEEKKEDKKADEKKRDMSKVKCYNFKKEGHFAKNCKKVKVKDYNYYKTKMLLAKKDSDEQVLLAEDQASMESSSDSDQEINADMVFMGKMEKVLSDSEKSSSSSKETIAEVFYYTSNSESEYEYETSEYYDNSTNYGLFVDNIDDQEIFHDAIESASENFNGNHIVSQIDHDESEVDHNYSKERDHLEKNNEFNDQIKVLNEMNVDFLAQIEVLQAQLKVKHVVIDTHTECQAQYAKLEEEIYEYMIRYSALCDNDKQHRKKIDKQEILFDKMIRQLVEMNNNVIRLQEKILEKETKNSELEEDDNNDGDHPKTSNTSPPVPPPTQQIPHTTNAIIKVIQSGNGLVYVTTDTNGIIKVLPPKTAKEVVARERERKARTTLLMALPEDHLAKFHKMADAKEMWEAIKSRFGGNDESKKMQKYLLKQQFEEIYGAGVSHENANQKFLRSLPSSWSQVALIMRTKPGLDTLSVDDLYYNLRVFEYDVKGTTASSLNTQNVAFVSSENTSSTNDVSTDYSVSSPSVSKSQKEGSSSYTNEVIHSFFANQSSSPQLDYDDLKQIIDDDMEEMDLKWQVAMISLRIKKFHKRTGRKAKRNQDSRRRDAGYSGNKNRDNGRRPAYQDDLKALVTIDGEDIDWSRHVEEDAQNYAMMDYSSSN
nr:ribonuclease H-like domain-containing protein [Tanacetum cinerariifolium]